MLLRKSAAGTELVGSPASLPPAVGAEGREKRGREGRLFCNSY